MKKVFSKRGLISRSLTYDNAIHIMIMVNGKPFMQGGKMEVRYRKDGTALLTLHFENEEKVGWFNSFLENHQHGEGVYRILVGEARLSPSEEEYKLRVDASA